MWLGWALQALGFLFHNNFKELSVISGEIHCRSKISQAFSGRKLWFFKILIPEKSSGYFQGNRRVSLEAFGKILGCSGC